MTKSVLVSFAASLMPIAGLPAAVASSHREAPSIAGNPLADNTDVFAFVSPDKPDTVTLIASFNPFQEPAGGPNFYKFSDAATYYFYVDNDGDAVEDITYAFDFDTTIQNPNTFLYNTGTITSLTDPDFNIRQTYTLTKIENGISTVLGSNLPVPPVNVGAKSTPNYAALSNAAISPVGTNMTVFAGQTDDPFFVELGGVFDLLNIRVPPGDTGGGVDGLKGFNVQSIALQIPINQLTANGTTPSSASDPNAIIGVWSATSLPATSVLSDATDGVPVSSGPAVQVSRLGAPLVNELVISLAKKDRWNNSKPVNDAQFANFVTNPELGTLINLIFGVNVPPQGNFGTANQRDDLIAIFLTGIPGLNKPASVVPSEQIRLNVAIPPTVNPNRLGVIAGDNQGYPNGRRLFDDVTDISLRAVAGVVYPLLHSGSGSFTVDPVGARLGDGVDTNDRVFGCTFPYLGLAWSGFGSIPHGNIPSVASPSCLAPPSSSSSSSSSSSVASKLIQLAGHLQVNRGDQLPYSVKLLNTTNATIPAVVTFPLPEASAFAGSTLPAGACAVSSGTVTCTLPSLAPNNAASFDMFFVVNAACGVEVSGQATLNGGPEKSAAVKTLVTCPAGSSSSSSSSSTSSSSSSSSVSSSSSSSSVPSSSSSSSSSVAPFAVTLSGHPQVNRGSSLPYTVLVSNNGASSLPVNVTFTIPANGTFTGSSFANQNNCVASGNTVTCTPANLAPSSQTSFDLFFTITAAATCESNVTGQATLNGSATSNIVTTLVKCPTSALPSATQTVWQRVLSTVAALFSSSAEAKF